MNIHAYGAMQNVMRSVTPNDFKGRVLRDGLPPHLRLQEGDSLQVTVVRQDGDSMTLQTEDGFQFSARQSGTPLPVGQTLELTVTQSTPQAMTVEVTDKSTVNLRTLLASFDAEMTQDNVDLANEILRQGAEPTKSFFQKLQNALSANKTLSPEQAVFMLKHGIPLNAKTVRQFQGFLQHQSQLGRQLGRLLDIFDALEPRQSRAASRQTQSQAPADAPAQPQAASTEPSSATAPAARPQTQTQSVPAAITSALPQSAEPETLAAEPLPQTQASSKTSASAAPSQPHAAAAQTAESHIPAQAAPNTGSAPTDPAASTAPATNTTAQPQAAASTEAEALALSQTQAAPDASAPASPATPAVNPSAQPQTTAATATSQAAQVQTEPSAPVTTAPSAPIDASPSQAQQTATAAATTTVTEPQTQTQSAQSATASAAPADPNAPAGPAPTQPHTQSAPVLPESAVPASPVASSDPSSVQPQTTAPMATATAPEPQAQAQIPPDASTAAPAQPSASAAPAPASPVLPQSTASSEPLTQPPVQTQSAPSAPAPAVADAPAAPPSTQPALPQPAASTSAAQPQTQVQNQTSSAVPAPAQSDVPSKTVSPHSPETRQAVERVARYPAAPPARTAQPTGARRDTTLRTLTETLFKDLDSLADAPTRDLRASRLRRELSELLQAVERRAPELPAAQRQEVVKTAREIEQHVKFMEHINNFTSYLQIPVQIGSQRTTAELYVFGDTRGQKRIDPENATVFLSLNTSSLGQVETFVKLIGKHVECDFSLENEKTASVFSCSMQSLAEGLTALGYTLARTTAKAAESRRDVLDVEREHTIMLEKYTVNRVV